LFTGRVGERYGYADRWDEDGVFIYSGEGQVGDLEFVRRNRTVRDHAKGGSDLHLFESLERGKAIATWVCSPVLRASYAAGQT
jgi:5-methylcytosine-specific restriction enzyme A